MRDQGLLGIIVVRDVSLSRFVHTNSAFTASASNFVYAVPFIGAQTHRFDVVSSSGVPQ